MSSTVLPRWTQPAVAVRLGVFARDYAVDLLVLLSAYFVATYMRKELPFGKWVGTNYEWHSARLYLLVAAALGVAYAMRAALGFNARRPDLIRFWTPFVGIALSSAALTAFLPTQSGLEKSYFALAACLLVLLVVPRSTADLAGGRPGMTESLHRLWLNRSLLRIWVQYNVQSRYAQAILGILWIVLLPLATAFVMSVVFSQIMRIQTHNAPFIAFFLAGFVPWGLFNQAVASGMRSILGAMGLINQIYFPREIIVLSALGEAVVDTLFMFLAMIVIDAVVGILPTPLYLILLPLFLIEIVLALGIMLVVSWLSVLIRDVPQLVSVVLQILFYLTPIIYPVTIIPHRFRALVTLNPLAVLIDAFHRIVVYHQQPDWFSLVYPTSLALALLIFGYRLFKDNEDRMADMV